MFTSENFKRLVLARMESYSVETMSGSFLSKVCVENLGDYSLKSSRGPKTSHSIRVLLFFSSISQPLSTPFGGACRNIGATGAHTPQHATSLQGAIGSSCKEPSAQAARSHRLKLNCKVSNPQSNLLTKSALYTAICQ